MTRKNRFSRREFIGAGLSGAAALFANSVGAQIRKPGAELFLYVGTYTTNGKSEGIYVYGFNEQTGKLSLLHTVRDVADPSYLAVSRDGGHLFAVNELVDFDGEKTGTVSSFAVNRTSGDLTFINKRKSLGGAPCYVAVTRNRGFVLVANYVGGSVASLPVGPDGRLGDAVSSIKRFGNGPNRDRQSSSHAHSIVLDRNERFAFAADLGTDEIAIFRFDAATGELVPNGVQPAFRTKSGAGPRHFEFHPAGKLAFVINELDLTITSLKYDESTGILETIETVPTLPPGISDPASSGADIHVSPDGRFLYGSNRGHDSIVAYRIRPTGKLEYVGHSPTLGRKPRNFAITPNGRYLLAANQASDSVVVFRIAPRSGTLSPTGVTAAVPAPVCLKFLSRG